MSVLELSPWAYQHADISMLTFAFQHRCAYSKYSITEPLAWLQIFSPVFKIGNKKYSVLNSLSRRQLQPRQSYLSKASVRNNRCLGGRQFMTPEATTVAYWSTIFVMWMADYISDAFSEAFMVHLAFSTFQMLEQMKNADKFIICRAFCCQEKTICMSRKRKH